MTAQPTHDRPATVQHFTAHGHRTLDQIAEHLAAAIDTSTPESIADGLFALYQTDARTIADLVDAIAAEAEPFTPAGGTLGNPLKPATDDIWADGWRQQLPGSWPYRPDEPHRCHRKGHWTRTGRLVLSCCGLDAT